MAVSCKVLELPATSRSGYPLIKKHPVSKIIVLFFGPGEGAVIASQSEDYQPIGFFGSNWREDEFEPFYGKVIIESY